ncbi:MAG: hypothetical protein KJP16_05470 [Gammaproteobacteria bacterium]|nr:hypothetical protein [Gammaproteobacteria bacterium]NNL50250.1 hypothetical protein [Woeseiaceae bacterium]
MRQEFLTPGKNTGRGTLPAMRTEVNVWGKAYSEIADVGVSRFRYAQAQKNF